MSMQMGLQENSKSIIFLHQINRILVNFLQQQHITNSNGNILNYPM